MLPVIIADQKNRSALGGGPAVAPAPATVPPLMPGGTIELQLVAANCVWPAPSIQMRCVWCWSTCCDDHAARRAQIWIAAGVTDMRRGFNG